MIDPWRGVAVRELHVKEMSPLRTVGADGDFAVAVFSHAARNNRLGCSIRMLDVPELVGHFVIERLVHPGGAYCW